MKKASERLQTVLMLAKLREKLAVEQLAKSIKKSASQQQQVSQLKSFQQEYSAQFLQTGANGASPQQLKNYQLFMSNLELAVDSKEQQLLVTVDEQEQARENWRYHYSKQKNMEGLVDKKRQQETRVLDKKLQLEQDDRRLYKPIG